MTGMYSDQTKITQNNVYLRNTVPDVITMGQRFRQQGYQSVRIGKYFIMIIPVQLEHQEQMIYIVGTKQLIHTEEIK